MCLDLKSITIKKQGTRKVYKLYSPLYGNSKHDLQSGINVCQYYQGGHIIIQADKDIVSNRNNKTLERYEKSMGAVLRGIHVFTSKKELFKGHELISFRSNSIWVECDAKTSDFVAEGTFHYGQFKSAVYMKITPRKLLDIPVKKN